MVNSFSRIFVDFFAYTIFFGSFYVVFATTFYFKYVLIPLTMFAFFYTVSNKFAEGFLLAKKMYGNPELINDLPDTGSEKKDNY